MWEYICFGFNFLIIKSKIMCSKVIVPSWLLVHPWSLLMSEILVNIGLGNNLSPNPCQAPTQTNPDSKVHGANMGPTWVLSAPDGPHIGPMNLAIRECLCSVNWTDPQKKPAAKFESNYNNILLRKCIWKFCLKRDSHFFQASMYECSNNKLSFLFFVTSYFI